VALPAGRVLPMSAPLFAVLKANHMGHNVRAPQVYEAIGYPADTWLDPTWGNTCAIRMSVALIAAGVKIRPGRLKIKAGRFKDEMVEPGQHRLSEFLAHAIGKPERYRGGEAARNTIAWRRGIISFFSLHGTNQGHIDLVSLVDWPELQCNGSCYWDSRDVWFWPLK
jgi:hypothetical protein